MNTYSEMYEVWSEQSFLDSAINIELLWTTNMNSVSDFNRAMREIAVEISPVHVLVSKSRVDRISKVLSHIPSSKSSSSRAITGAILPRLEVLSRFMEYSIDFHIERLRLSLFRETGFNDPTNFDVENSSKMGVMRNAISSFLSVVSSFDLSFPHEEALASAMQISIDRLTGLGVPLEDSWEMTNTALLNFLEDMSGVEVGASAAEHLPSTFEGLAFEGEDSECVGDVIQRAVESSTDRTISQFAEFADPTVSFSGDLMEEDFVFDIPDGVSGSFVGMFYDKFSIIYVPTVFITDSAGIHILRVTPPEGKEGAGGSNHGSLSQASDENARDGDSFQSDCGLVMRSFSLDKEYSFGCGGMSLSVLGSDSLLDMKGAMRSRERIDDLDAGEIEVFFTRPVFERLVATGKDTMDPVMTVPPTPQSTIQPTVSVDRCLLVSSICSSILLSSDNFTPFLRLILQEQVLTRESSILSPGDACSSVRSEDSIIKQGEICCSSKALTMLNLTREGEMYPEIAVSIPNPIGPRSRFFLKYSSNETARYLELLFRGARVTFLQQHVNEIMQYFLSGDYGFGLFLKSLGPRDGAQQTEKGLPLRLSIKLVDSSLIIPRSTTNADLLCMELDEMNVSSSSPSRTFQMPTVKSPLVVPGNELVDVGTAPAEKESQDWSSDVWRLSFGARGIRVFSSLPVAELELDETGSPSFRFFYAIDGRAQPGKPVYSRREYVEDGENYEEDENSELQRLWKEITREPVNLDIIFDRAPNRRILISDPFDSTPNHFDFDMDLSQFCLLLSVWYANMQELPMNYPYTAQQIKDIARGPNPEGVFPEYGTEEFRDLLSTPSSFTTEICLMQQHLTMRCRIKELRLDGNGGGIQKASSIILDLRDLVVHVTNDDKGVSRIGTGASGVSFIDESKQFDRVIQSRMVHRPESTWADLEFGLHEDYHTLSRFLPQVFQFSVFMTPGWSLYNIGLDDAEISFADFSTFFAFLDFVTMYFKDPKYGNPQFDAVERAGILKQELQKHNSASENDDSDAGACTDFRLWLSRPVVRIPCDPHNKWGPTVRLPCEGFWYRYSNIDHLSSHELVSKDMDLFFDDDFSDGNVARPRQLIGGLGFGLRMDYSDEANHSDMAIQIPYDKLGSCSVVSERVTAMPDELGPATICSPLEEPHRFLGAKICEITVVVELLPRVLSSIYGLFKSEDESDEESSSEAYSSASDAEIKEENSVASSVSTNHSEDLKPSDDATFSIVAQVGDIRVFSFDPVLGPHLPIGVISIASLGITASNFGADESRKSTEAEQLASDDLQVLMKGHFWADYFKLGLTRSWEPLIEAYMFDALYETSKFRGSGLSISSDTTLHLNVSGSLLVIIDEVVDSFYRLVRETFGDGCACSEERQARHSASDGRMTIEDSHEGLSVIHELPRAIKGADRVAFSIRNMSGQRLRLRKPENQMSGTPVSGATLTIVGHAQSAQLSFQPSISMVKNLSVVEVGFPGLPNSVGMSRQKGEIPPHVIDLQLPGFNWLRGIQVDSFGRSFSALAPRSSIVSDKIRQDWRLENALRVLVEVGLFNGGRQVTVRSLFSVINHTSHRVNIFLHPDPKCEPFNLIRDEVKECDVRMPSSPDTSLDPGELFQIPVLLAESALKQTGSHLGSIWLRPDTDCPSNASTIEAFLRETEGNSADVEYSSRPVQLAKIVSESSLIFESNNGNQVSPELATSGVHMSCPVGRGSEKLTPFCYVVEVGRSPLVKDPAREKEQTRRRPRIHSPVAYTLSIHPTFVIVNLLPERGRFELMHAVRRNVIWFADLEPGQKVSVHSVGLDAPLLLLLNLGFCRTPVGEGALVHHGVDAPRGARGRFERVCLYSVYMFDYDTHVLLYG